MLEAVKLALRIMPDQAAFDGEIEDLIEAALADLRLVGVSKPDCEDPLIKRAVVTYCKANFGFDNPDADRLRLSYHLLRDHLSLAEGYGYAL